MSETPDDGNDMACIPVGRSWLDTLEILRRADPKFKSRMTDDMAGRLNAGSDDGSSRKALFVQPDFATIPLLPA